jgi:hypothetical protein
MATTDPFDPINLVISPELAALNDKAKASLRKTTKPRRKPRQVITGNFVPPIPLGWIVKASRLSGRALEVAIAIRIQSAFMKSQPVSLTNWTMKLFRIDVYAKSRALSSLEQAGLIQIERKPGCNPVVTIMEIEEEDYD